jgi:hypothetical protein
MELPVDVMALLIDSTACCDSVDDLGFVSLSAFSLVLFTVPVMLDFIPVLCVSAQFCLKQIDLNG